MSKHQICPRCHSDFVGPDTHINENICTACNLNEKEILCEAQCPACGEMVKIYELGFTVCPHCKGTRVELMLTDWEIIEDKEDD